MTSDLRTFVARDLRLHPRVAYQGLFCGEDIAAELASDLSVALLVLLVTARTSNDAALVISGFNAIGRIAGGVAGVVGAKGVVNSGFDGVKKAIGKSGLMQGVLSPFGEVEVLDELRDMWTHESKVRKATCHSHLYSEANNDCF